jgi:hypothetical protein
MDFFLFWFRCFYDSANLWWNIVLWADSVVTIIAAGYLVHRRGKPFNKSDTIMRVAFHVGWVVFAFSFLLINPYVQYGRKSDEANEAKDQWVTVSNELKITQARLADSERSRIRLLEQVSAQGKAAPDYIVGTKFTYNKLREVFPFGYTIFWSKTGSQETTDRFKVVKTGRTEWEMDWDNVIMEVDYSNHIVTWKLPSVSAQGPGLSVGGGLKMQCSSAFKAGQIHLAPLVQLPGGQPVLHVGTLSDDQLSPVFVIGLRICTDRIFTIKN